MARPEVQHVVDGMQICRRCEVSKPVDQFHKNSTKPSGLVQYCKLCDNLNRKESRYRVRDGATKFIRGSWHSKKGTREYNDHMKDKFLQRFYSITLEDYNKLFSDQGGCCAICKTHQSDMKKALHVDHDHKTGEIRGLLCYHCNMGIGIFKDDIEMLQNVINYLQNHEKKHLLKTNNLN